MGGAAPVGAPEARVLASLYLERVAARTLARCVLAMEGMTRIPADGTSVPALALHHEFCCASRSALAAAYTSASEAPWVECCSVDLQALRLVLRLSPAGPRAGRRTLEWLRRIERVAQGLPTRR